MLVHMYIRTVHRSRDRVVGCVANSIRVRGGGVNSKVWDMWLRDNTYGDAYLVDTEEPRTRFLSRSLQGHRSGRYWIG